MPNREPDEVLSIQGLSRRFGKTLALDDVSLELRRSTVLGLIGENGAGKTTLIKHVLGLYRATAGTVRVFGLDPSREPVAVLSRIGSLTDERDLPGWMRVDELLRYMSAFYPTWDPAYAERLRNDFELPARGKLKTLSRGQFARAGLLVAIAHRPELLVLDEPSSGLDPVVRRDILDAIIRSIGDDGRTVLFSSHLLDEIERVSDRIAMIDQGRIVLDAPVDEIAVTHHWITIRRDEPEDAPPPIPGELHWDRSEREWRGLIHLDRDGLTREKERFGERILEIRPAALDDVFLRRVGARRRATTMTEA